MPLEGIPTQNKSKIPPFFNAFYSLNMVSNIVTTEAVCLTNQVDIATYSKKMFLEPFINAIKALHLVSQNENLRILEFKRFINEFGTHYASTSEMGTKLSIGMLF